ncbi:MAG TPA: hypothetical protein VHG91_21400 [Longimicrobium sp.]|nr:hypothetical protein [Longimicrobium sp.]
MSIALRPRSAGEVLDASFQVLRQHYVTLVSAPAALLLPLVATRLLLPQAWLLSVLQPLLSVFATAAVVVMVADLYMGRRPDVGRAMTVVGERWWAVLVTALFQMVMVWVGFLLLIVPGIVFAAMSFAMPMTVVVEGGTAGDSFERSRELASGHLLRILGTAVLAWLIYMLAFMAISAILSGLGILAGAPRLATALGEAVSILFFPCYAVVATVLYFDIRIRKEAFDVEMLTRQMSEVFPPEAVVAR